MITKKGYVRLKSKPYRDCFEHRINLAKLTIEFCYYELSSDNLPIGFHVHHMDFNRVNNCYCNLLLIQDIIHDACNDSKDLRCPFTGRFMRRDKWYRDYGKKEPDWVTREC